MQSVNGFFSLETLAIIAIFIFMVSYTVLYRQNRALLHENDRFAERQNIITRVNEILASDQKFENALKAMANELHDHMKADIVGLYLCHQSGKTVHLAAYSGLAVEVAGEIRFLKPDDAFVGSVLSSRQPVFEPDLVSKPRLTNSIMKREDWLAMCAVPVIFKDEALGVLFAVRTKQPAFSAEHTKFLSFIGGLLGAPTKSAILEASLKKHTVKDLVTQLYTREAFDRYLKTEIMRSERFARVISLVLIKVGSLNEFKQICGDSAMTNAMRDIGKLISHSTRTFDIACRHDDSLFAILLPETDAEGAQIVAERIQNAMGKAMFDNGSGDRVIKLPVTVSVATYPYVLAKTSLDDTKGKHEFLMQAAMDALADISQPGNPAAIA